MIYLDYASATPVDKEVLDVYMKLAINIMLIRIQYIL